MSKTDKIKVVPDLRFSEFKNDGEWNVNVLGGKNVSIFVNQKTPLTKLNIETYVSTENLLSDYSGITKASKLPESGSFTTYKKGDILIANIRPYLKKVWFSDKEGAASNDVIVIRAASDLEETFLRFLLQNDEFINYVMEGAKGVKMPRGDKSLMMEYPIAFPKPKEQQKIADCLSSIDDFIKTQSQKLEALRAHKKGLLQNLFPAEGETVPLLRFKGFDDDENWVEKTLVQVVNYENGKAHEQDIDEQGDYIVVNSKFISTDGEVKKYTNSANLLAKKGDILMVLSDVPNGRAIAKCFYVDRDDTYTVNQRICKLTSKKAVSLVLFYLINRNPYFLAFDDGVKQTNLRKDDVLNCPLLLPKNPKEQQKIADCLSTIDELINAQSQKLEALKAHKKGLIQQLFPNTNELINE